jgi:hypothetical protein
MKKLKNIEDAAVVIFLCILGISIIISAVSDILDLIHSYGHYSN